LAHPGHVIRFEQKEQSHEAHFSAQQSRACPSPRFSRPHRDGRWPQYPACAPCPGPQEAFGLIEPDAVHPAADGAGESTLRPGLKLAIITKRADFLAANHAIRVARPGFVLLVHRRPGDEGALRFGVTVTKKIGNAVMRNRMKRRFRALLREVLPLQGVPGADHVLIGRDTGIERNFALLRQELSGALARAAAGKGDAPRKGRGHRPPPRK
jgi:ribonuclease P protein component